MIFFCFLGTTLPTKTHAQGTALGHLNGFKVSPSKANHKFGETAKLTTHNSLTPDEPQKKQVWCEKNLIHGSGGAKVKNSIKQSSVTTHVTHEYVGYPADTCSYFIQSETKSCIFTPESCLACPCECVDFKIQNASKVLKADCG